MVPQALVAGISASRHKSLHSLAFYCSAGCMRLRVPMVQSLLEALTFISANHERGLTATSTNELLRNPLVSTARQLSRSGTAPALLAQSLGHFFAAEGQGPMPIQRQNRRLELESRMHPGGNTGGGISQFRWERKLRINAGRRISRLRGKDGDKGLGKPSWPKEPPPRTKRLTGARGPRLISAAWKYVAVNSSPSRCQEGSRR
jgi:hypothetical protein